MVHYTQWLIFMYQFVHCGKVVDTYDVGSIEINTLTPSGLVFLYQLILYADFRNMSRPTFNFRQISIYKYITRKIKNGLQCFLQSVFEKNQIFTFSSLVFLLSPFQSRFRSAHRTWLP